MNPLIEIVPECPVCKSRHRQSFSWEDLHKLLQHDSINLYCPRHDKSWRATQEQREHLAHIANSFTRLYKNVTQPGIVRGIRG
jgi:hypothetical protein